MRITLTFPVTHRCPFVEEIDVGTATVELSGPAPELHAFRTEIYELETKTMTHEEFTERLHAICHAPVTTRWNTAGIDVEVRVP